VCEREHQITLRIASLRVSRSCCVFVFVFVFVCVFVCKRERERERRARARDAKGTASAPDEAQTQMVSVSWGVAHVRRLLFVCVGATPPVCVCCFM